MFKNWFRKKAALLPQVTIHQHKWRSVGEIEHLPLRKDEDGYSIEHTSVFVYVCKCGQFDFWPHENWNMVAHNVQAEMIQLAKETL